VESAEKLGLRDDISRVFLKQLQTTHLTVTWDCVVSRAESRPWREKRSLDACALLPNSANGEGSAATASSPLGLEARGICERDARAREKGVAQRW
jgi:hypothetical protein